jgi:hypothetical protein
MFTSESMLSLKKDTSPGCSKTQPKRGAVPEVLLLGQPQIKEEGGMMSMVYLL